MVRIGEALLGIGLLILVLADAVRTMVVARHARAIPLLTRTLLAGGWRRTDSPPAVASSWPRRPAATASATCLSGDGARCSAQSANASRRASGDNPPVSRASPAWKG